MQYLQILLLLIVAAEALGSSLGPALTSQDSCETSCGDLAIEFPFGTKEGCYHASNFLWSNHAQQSIFEGEGFLDLIREQFCCHWLRHTCLYYREKAGIGSDIGTGCISSCSTITGITNGSCSGVGCCEIDIPERMSYVDISLSSYKKHKDILGFNPCSYGFVVQKGKFNFSTKNLLDFGSVKKMPMLLEWAIGNKTCEIARMDSSTNFLCKGNSECVEGFEGPGYRCRCKDGYAGNPYMEDSCKNINECEQKDPRVCKHECIDLDGDYECRCPKGYSGGDKKDGTGCVVDESNESLIIQIVVGTLATAIFLLIFIAWLYLGLKKRKLIKLKEKFFRQNGGILLQQRISGEGGSHHDRAKVFTIEELKRATNNYDETRIIGKGGYGTVYKGVLSDKRIVAIKKSKLVDQTQSQIEQFINEVVILSQINHRNVVKLIGCCLETEVPLLVYEFISNGTLSDHIHNESKSLALTWDIRLRIATGTAGALSYLHSAASVPIIHRDIKPTNILVDDNYVAKVSDFGASKLIPMDQVELATIVQGTLGYLDPEYLQTNQLTDKSDVYSFGVVLVELLTRKQALRFDRPEKERNIAIYFLSSLKEGRLFQVLEERLLLNEGIIPNDIIDVSRLAKRCLRVKGDERPTMKEVAMELEGILASMTEKHPWGQTTLNEEEYEHLLKQVPIDHDYEFIDGSKASSSTFDSY
ncbi:hypothetical protein OSB04_018288 [Centaurea solstitialis]|uniref:Uncharacterized protein n=1 Tax=Centaurea solstitialis TaxID=347529 RepID=A0AA38TPI0_9ASTR|nr:hypothetical protein OSB04_018288 [Centaurea solstitialis]